MACSYSQGDIITFTRRGHIAMGTLYLAVFVLCRKVVLFSRFPMYRESNFWDLKWCPL